MDFNINALNISNQLFQQQQQSNNIPLANTFFNNNNTSATAISQGILAYSNALGFCPVAENSNSDPTFLSSPINSSNIWEQHSSSNASEASSFNNIEGPSNLSQQHLSTYPNCWTAFSNYNTNNTLNENSSPESFSNFAKTNNNNNIGQIRTTRQPFSCLTNNNLVEDINLEKGLEHSNHHIKTENNSLKCPSSTAKEFRTELERLKYWERRSKNNEAAKHSRTKRREREQLLQQKVMELERENLRLRNELEEEKRRKYKSEMNEF